MRCDKIKSGDRFGRLVVVKKKEGTPKGRGTRSIYECICDCGNTSFVAGSTLSYGGTKSCGCLAKENTSRRVYSLGDRFGRLTITAAYYGRHGKQRTHLCKCDCGNTIEVQGSNLKSKHVMSCGCLRAENTKKMKTTHGMTESRIYEIWYGMKKRCKNPSSEKYHRYGGRGISVCCEWHDFSVFMGWALGHGYAENLTIDRIDNDGNYCPDNCRWITSSENSKKQKADREKSKGVVLC